MAAFPPRMCIHHSNIQLYLVVQSYEFIVDMPGGYRIVMKGWDRGPIFQGTYPSAFCWRDSLEVDWSELSEWSKKKLRSFTYVQRYHPEPTPKPRFLSDNQEVFLLKFYLFISFVESYSSSTTLDYIYDIYMV